MSEEVRQSGLRPVRLGMYPVLDNLESVVEMGNSQLPVETPNQLMAILMVYHNTMVKIMEEEKNDKTT